MTNLGVVMNVAVFAIKDVLDEAGAHRLLKMVIQRTGMTPVLRPAVWRYPIMGMGGVGETVGQAATVTQPAAVIQPLAESLSMAITDSWHEHEGFFLILCSCRPFRADRLERYLKKRGWKVVEVSECSARLKMKKSVWKRMWG